MAWPPTFCFLDPPFIRAPPKLREYQNRRSTRPPGAMAANVDDHLDLDDPAGV
jgi:hypothetical protein